MRFNVDFVDAYNAADLRARVWTGSAPTMSTLICSTCPGSRRGMV